jgi:hypothetical protein
MDSTSLISEFIFGDDADVFKGNKVRVVNENPKKVSLYDVMSILGDKNPSKTIIRLKEKFPEVIPMCYSNIFKTGQGQKNTPVVDAKGLITILMLLPGEKAALFRYKASNILVRYLAGDLSLIPEIEENNEIQEINPDNFGFRDMIKDSSKLDKNISPYISEMLTPTIIDTMLAPNIVYLLWIGFCHNDNVHIWKYGKTYDFKDRSRLHKSEQKSEAYILQISLGTHPSNNLEKTIEKIVYKYGIKINNGKECLHRENFITRNFTDLQDIVTKIVKVANSNYFSKYVKDIRIAPGIISESLLIKSDITRLKLQYEFEIAKKQLELKNIETKEVLDNTLNEVDIDNLELDEYSEISEDNVSEIIESENEEEVVESHISIVLPTYPYDIQEKVETLDEFIEKFCDLDIDGKINRPILYEAFSNYISQSGFIGKITFYNKIETNYLLIKRSITCPDYYNGINTKPGVIKDVYVYIRDFIHMKCNFREDYRVNSEELSDSFLNFIKDSKISDHQVKILGLHKVNFNSILKKNYPFKFQHISKHTQGWCGLKLKSQIIHELSDLVQTFYNTKIEKSIGNHINRRPVFHCFLEWYNEKYSMGDAPKSWTKSQFREEFKKHVKFSSDKWRDIKLID